MSPAGFEPTIPVSERPKTHALDHTATGIDTILNYLNLLKFSMAIKLYNGLFSTDLFPLFSGFFNNAHQKMFFVKRKILKAVFQLMRSCNLVSEH
jgi:hypothetical protein